ncbi:MAG: glycoside hydrolase family 113, partial [Bryobacteraceae bacterium]
MRRAFYALALAALAPLAVAQSLSGFEYNGIVHASWQPTEYTTAAAFTSEQALASTHASWASVVVTWYQDTVTSTTIAPVATTSPTDAAVEQAIQNLHSLGLKVMLKPHVDLTNPVDGQWRGDINPPAVDAWFASYTSFIVKYAQMAQALGVEGLDMGTELADMTGSANQSRWKAVIDAIRANYSGLLAYGANATYLGDEFTSVSFWQWVDIIGLDGYFPLTNHADPSLAELVAAWRNNLWGQSPFAAIQNLYNAYQKPIIFTELGYESAAGTNTQPYAYGYPAAYDPTEQRNCYDAFFLVWSPQSSWMKGVFWWDWEVTQPGPADLAYSAWGRPAEDVLRAWYGPPNASNAVTNAASYATNGVAPGGLVALWGDNLASGLTTAPAGVYPWPQAIAGTSVTMNGLPAPLYFVSPGQVNAQVPFELAPGSAMAEVTSPAGVTTWIPVTVQTAGPGIFTLNASGSGDAALLDAQTYRPITSASPAKAAEWIQIYATGLGAVNQAVTDGVSSLDRNVPLSTSIEVSPSSHSRIGAAWCGKPGFGFPPPAA